jgi:hypothetical protein
LGGFNVINCQGGEKETARAVGNLFIRCKFQINQIVQVLLSNLISGKLRPDEMKRETIIKVSLDWREIARELLSDSAVGM